MDYHVPDTAHHLDGGLRRDCCRHVIGDAENGGIDRGPSRYFFLADLSARP